MLLLPTDLVRLRSTEPEHCSECGQDTCKNYCRDCDEFFWDGHADSCSQHSPHSNHRNYRTFSGTTESDLAELDVEYRQEAARATP